MRQSTVVITGIGIVSSIGTGGDAYFDSLLAARSGIQSLAARTDDGVKPNGAADPAGLWIGAPIVDFDPKPFVRPRKALKVMCREIQTAYVASQLAIKEADLESVFPCDPEGTITPDRVGTVFGSEMLYGPPREMIDTFNDSTNERGEFDDSRFGQAAMRGITPLWMLKYLPNMPACHVGIAINAHGPNNSLILGDVSGPAAMMESNSCIERGIADVMICGSTGTRINTTRLVYRNDLPIASVADPAAQSSRPHDPASAGVIGGEGASSLVLESAEHADRRGAKVIAVIAGAANRFIASQAIRNGRRSAQSKPQHARGSADAIASAIQAAIDQAHKRFGLSASDVGAVVSHGMGDTDTDGAEQAAVRRVLPGVAMVAPIASIGYTGAASGGIAMATAGLMLSRRTIPPTLNANRAMGVNLLSCSQPLSKPCVVCLAHTAEGSATAVVLTAS
tara:strand:+ start:217398 stop:218750 length:1353 start_codon:yes stop_codon:yes gene_type:complete